MMSLWQTTLTTLTLCHLMKALGKRICRLAHGHLTRTTDIWPIFAELYLYRRCDFDSVAATLKVLLSRSINDLKLQDAKELAKLTVFEEKALFNDADPLGASHQFENSFPQRLRTQNQ